MRSCASNQRRSSRPRRLAGGSRPFRRNRASAADSGRLCPAAPRPATVERTSTSDPAKIWLQLASGHDAGALSNQFERLKSHNHELFQGITAYVAQGSDRDRLVIGPFRGSSDARIFSEDLHTIGVDAFRWTNSSSDRIVPIAVE